MVIREKVGENLQKKFDKVLFYNIEEIFSFTENKDIIKIIEFVLKKKENYPFAFYSKDFSSFVNSKKKNLLTMINDLISLNEYFNYYETYSKINDILIYKHNILDFTFELNVIILFFFPSFRAFINSFSPSDIR